jgi:hypothetical protein
VHSVVARRNTVKNRFDVTYGCASSNVPLRLPSVSVLLASTLPVNLPEPIAPANLPVEFVPSIEYEPLKTGGVVDAAQPLVVEHQHVITTVTVLRESENSRRSLAQQAVFGAAFIHYQICLECKCTDAGRGPCAGELA